MALKKVAILAVLSVFTSGCFAAGRSGGNSNAGLIVAGAAIGAAILGHAFISSKEADVKKELIRANTVSNAACNLGGKGNAGYQSTEGTASINADAAYSPEQCAQIKMAQQTGYARVGANSVYGRANAYAICDQIPNPSGRNNCRRDVDQQIEYDLRDQARNAARLRY